MQFISITGFPRTGTTWLQRNLLNSKDCCGTTLELGFPRLWYEYKKIKGLNEKFPEDIYWGDERTQSISHTNLSPLLWFGFYGVKVAFNNISRYFDGICNAFRNQNKGVFIEKTPCDIWQEDWPCEYIKQSRIFDDYALIITYRPFDSLWNSGIRYFKHWSTNINRKYYYLQWKKYYEAAKNVLSPNITIVNLYSNPSKNTNILYELCDKHEISRPEKIVKWVQHV